MAKPPKKVPGSRSSDPSSTTTRPTSENSPVASEHINTGRPRPPVQAEDSTPGAHSSDTSTGGVTHQPSVVVTDMPGSTPRMFETALSEIAWPRNRYVELVPTGENTGLFHSPDLRIYAEIGDEGRFMVERNRQGEYLVPLSFAPGVPGPILAKIEGQPRWRIERPGWVTTAEGSSATVPTIAAPMDTRPMKVISQELATRLPEARETDGIRYDSLGRMFVDTATEGTTLIRKNAVGDYQSTGLAARDPSGPVLERIQGSKLWQRKPQNATSTEESPRADSHQSSAADEESGSSPGKRPRLDDNVDSSNAGARPGYPLDHGAVDRTGQTPYFWLPWGQINKPVTGESVQLGWLHYPIVPLGSATNHVPKVYFLQHPEFAPSHFDAFERMLQDAPSLQPVATFRMSYDPREVRPGKRFFDKPLSLSVSDTFMDFSDLTSRAVARKLFELSDNSPVITTTGLINIQAVLQQWNQKPFPTTPAFADPMNMLPVTAATEIAGKKIIRLPPDADGPLQRLTFDPQHFPVEWNHYTADASDYNLRRLVGALLVRSGYDVFPLTHEHRKPTLVFKRANHDNVFFLKLGAIKKDTLAHDTSPGSELADPHLLARIGSDAHQALNTANAENKVVWLLGGALKAESGSQSVFVIRER